MTISTIKSDVFKFLERTEQQHTIIFADPPYDFSTEEFSKIPQLVFQNNLLEKDGLLIVEHSKHTDISHNDHYSHSKGYGSNMFSFFKLPESE